MDETTTPELTETEAPVTEAPEVTTVTETTEIVTSTGFDYIVGCYNRLGNIETVSYYILGMSIMIIASLLGSIIIKSFFGRG